MGFVDVDAHISECSDTWDYLPTSMEDIRPAEMTFGAQPAFLKRPMRGLFIDGQVYQQLLEEDEVTHTTVGTRELRDIPTRLKHMDELGIDVQVIYPTLLLREVTRRPEVEAALCESFNRWLADRCSTSGGRLRWTASLPLRSIPEALREMKRAKDDGAVGVFKRCFECDGRRAGDPYFDPIYALAEELELPICFHASFPYAGYHNTMTKTQMGPMSVVYMPDALNSIFETTTKTFRRLKFGFIEGASGWLPWMMWMLNRKGDTTRERFAGMLEENRIYVTCEASENLPEIIGQVGDENLCVGTDYVHSGRGMLFAHKEIMERTDIDSGSAKKITDSNGRRFYGLD